MMSFIHSVEGYYNFTVANLSSLCEFLNKKSVIFSPSLVLVEEIIHLSCSAVSICWFISDFPLFSILNEQLHTAQKTVKGLVPHLINVHCS